MDSTTTTTTTATTTSDTPTTPALSEHAISLDGLENIYFKKLHENARIPTRATPYSAAFDLYALRNTLVIGGAGTVLVDTGVAVRLPPGTYGRIAMRSGLALNKHLAVNAGVIDPDYNKSLGVMVYNTQVFSEIRAPHLTLNVDWIAAALKSGKSTFIPVMMSTAKVDPESLHEFEGQLCTSDGVSDTHTPVYIVPVPGAYEILAGERFAQLIIERAHYGRGIEVDEFPPDAQLDGSEHAGFGSTGKK
jgi:deoxyuridine 5'-triphosphate nucleotidohydrolase